MTTALSGQPPPAPSETGPFHAPVPLPAPTVQRLLGRVRKPGRYSGGEWNSVQKDWSETALKWCFAYPDLYEIGMSNLGLRILYEVVNDRPDCLAERCFAPDVDLQRELRAAKVPLWSLETQRSLGDFDVVGLSLGYELVATNVLDMLELAGIGLTTGDRSEADPLVIAGGPIVLNPEPFADFTDAVVLGEGEDVVPEISEVLLSLGWHRRVPEPGGESRRGVDRATALRALARISGVYVPSLYRPRYEADGAFAALDRIDEAAPARVAGRIAAGFETAVHGIRQIVPNVGIVFDRAQIEVMRGCTRGCRFCQAGMLYRPLRERAPELVTSAADSILASTGYEEIGLTSLSTADYTFIAEVAGDLARRHPDVTLSLPSTRVDAFTVELADAIAPTGRRGGITFAPEAGSQRLRDGINKGVDDREILRCAELAFDRGWSSLKLYFMIGLPGETEEDIRSIADLCRQIIEMGRRKHGGRAQVKASVSTFVPKVMTPFQWDGQDSIEEIEAKIELLRKALHGRGLSLAWTDPHCSILEAVLGRGDRRLGEVIRLAWQKGARFDAWDEHFGYDLWLEAFREAGLDPAWYAQRDIDPGESLPWGHLSTGVSSEFLLRERKRAVEGRTTPDCRSGPCARCGLPASTGFACDTGERGPRRTTQSTPELDRIRAAQPRVARSGGRGTVDFARAETSGQTASVGMQMQSDQTQSKDAGSRDSSSPVEAAGGESTS
ncbi:MAG: TIGR03960 family B12-binding radical SAM protein [Candidatus Limnocylindrales bacterium]